MTVSRHVRPTAALLVLLALAACGQPASPGAGSQDARASFVLEAGEPPVAAGGRVVPLVSLEPSVFGGASVVKDREAQGGKAVRLPTTDSGVRFTMPAGTSGWYVLKVRGRGQHYDGWPRLRLDLPGARGAGLADLDALAYSSRTLGLAELQAGSTLDVVFTNDRWGGSSAQDRDAFVDYLVVEPAPGPLATLYVRAGAAGQTGSTPADALGSLQDAVARAAAGTTVRVAAGVYRESALARVPNLTLLGESGAEILGSDVWSGWARRGATWSLRYSLAWDPHGQCRPGSNGRCGLPDQVFVGGVAQLQQTSAGAVGPGSFFVGDGKIVLGTDPAGKLVEVSLRDRWLQASGPEAQGVTVAGFRMRHATNKAQMGALADNGAAGWVVRANRLELAHGANLKVDGDGAVVDANTLSRAGQLNLAGSGGVGQSVTGNLIERGNLEDFDPGWEAGGMKLSRASSLLVSGNEVAYNDGPGLWCDIDCAMDGAPDSVRIVSNRVHHNARQGISFEISGPESGNGCLIGSNRVWENGHYLGGFGRPRSSGWAWGAGILVQNSSGCTVRDNVVAWNGDGISLIQQDRTGSDSMGFFDRELMLNNLVTGNVVAVATAGQDDDDRLLAWMSDVVPYSLFAESSRNGGSLNRYHDRSLAGAAYWEWAGKQPTLDAFNATPGEQDGLMLSAAELDQVLRDPAVNVPAGPESW